MGIRECAFLGVPTVNIGTRQSGRDRGKNVLDAGYHREEIVAAIRQHLQSGRYESDPIYGQGEAGERIAELLARQPLGIEKRLTY